MLNQAKGNTLLMLAAYAGHADLVSELLNREADPNRINDNMQSPIAGAVFKGYEKVVQVLIEGGADPRQGKPTAIETAFMFNKKELLKVLGAKEGDISDAVPKPLDAAAAGY
jgi:ankyrin repeat protein